MATEPSTGEAATGAVAASDAPGHALVTTAHGGPEVLAWQPRRWAPPAAGVVRVGVRAAALNHLDLWVQRGVPAGAWRVPIVPAADGAGVVAAIGPGVTAVRPGDAVVLYPVRGCGGCRACRRGSPMLCHAFGMLGETTDGCAATFVEVPAATLLAKPEGLSFVQAAALPTTMLTAWHMLATTAAVRPGEVVVVSGARAGVGVAAVQIARLLGAHVIALVRRDADADAIRALGADDVLRSDDDEWPRKVRAIAGGGADVVFEHVGGEVFAGAIKALRRGGRLVTCGATAGAKVELDLRKIFFHSIALHGATMGTLAECETVLQLAGRGALRPVVGAVFAVQGADALAQGRAAFAALAGRTVFGKVVLDLDRGDGAR